MEKARYTVKALADECGVSVQSIYSLKKNNDELRELCEAHSSKVKGANSYGPAVLDWLLAYYQKAPEQPVKPVESPQLEPEGTDKSVLETALEAKEAEIKALKAELDAARADITTMANTIADMNQQNGHLLFLLGEEQKRVLLLEAPKKNFIQKIAEHFRRNHKDA